MLKASVVLASYNRNRSSFLGPLLESLQTQDLPSNDFEVVIVDNGSTQDVRNLLSSYQKDHKIPNFQYLQLEGNPGPAKARNLGVKRAKGNVIFFTDDDCLTPKNWVSSFLKALDQHPEVVAVGGFQRAADDVLKKNAFAQYEWFMTSKIFRANDQEYIGGFETPAVVTNNMAIRKSVFQSISGFDEGFVVAAGEDADLKKRLTDKHYKLMYYPLGVEHHQEYGLRRFIRQSFLRGIGSRHFQRKYKFDYSNKQLSLMILKNPFLSFIKILRLSKRLDFAFIAAIGEFFGLKGQLNYDSFTKK